jgi:hypothetical protein
MALHRDVERHEVRIRVVEGVIPLGGGRVVGRQVERVQVGLPVGRDDVVVAKTRIERNAPDGLPVYIEVLGSEIRRLASVVDDVAGDNAQTPAERVEAGSDLDLLRGGPAQIAEREEAKGFVHGRCSAKGVDARERLEAGQNAVVVSRARHEIAQRDRVILRGPDVDSLTPERRRGSVQHRTGRCEVRLPRDQPRRLRDE